MKRCEIRGEPGQSNYFGGGYRGYGRYQWNVKYYGWQNEHEIEDARSFFFSMDDWSGLENRFTSEFGRKIEARFDGRSGGWLVIDTELSKRELRRVDAIVKQAMRGLKRWLVEERKVRAEIDAEMDAEKG